MVDVLRLVSLREEVQVVALFCLLLSSQCSADSFSLAELKGVEGGALSISPAGLEQYRLPIVVPAFEQHSP